MPAFTALTDLATVKLQLSIASGNTADDTYLGNLIAAVSAAISKYCNRNFLTASYTETYNGSGNGTLWLRNRPISAVASVNVNGTPAPARVTVNDGGYTFDQNKVYWPGGWFPEGAQNVVVSYTAGLPAISAAATPGLWQAAAEWVATEYQQRNHIDKKSDGIVQGGSTVYLGEMPWTVRAAVDPYRQVATEYVLGD